MKRIHKRKIRAKPITRVIICLILLFGLFSFCESRVRMLPPEYIHTSANSFAEKIINEIVEERLESATQTYTVNKDSSGRAMSVDTDPAALTKLKSGLADSLNKRLCGSYTAFVPFGSLLDHKLLNGWGFPVPVNLYFTGSAKVELKSDIVSAGINQSKYRMVMDVEAELASTSVTDSGSYTYKGEYLMCEVVLVGEVPIIAGAKSA